MARPQVRYLVLGLVTVYVLLALGSGADRIGEQDPAIAKFVPSPFRAASARAEARTGLAAGDIDGALQSARAVVTADPVDHRSAGLLGAAYLAAGDAGKSEEAFRVSARLGWREPLTQAYWLEAALAGGDYSQAALRLDALLRQGAEISALAAPLPTLEGAGAPRAALLGRLRLRPGWIEAYLGSSQSLPVPVLLRRAAVLLDLGNGGTRLGCEATVGMASALNHAGAGGEARQLWNLHCPERAVDGPITDRDFIELGNDNGGAPFGWQRHLSGDIEVSASDKGLTAWNQAPASRLILTQATGFLPGRYRISAVVQDGSVTASSALVASLDCSGQPAYPRGPVGELVEGGQQILVPDNCPFQMLGLWLRPSSHAVTIRSVAVTRED